MLLLLPYQIFHVFTLFDGVHKRTCNFIWIFYNTISFVQLSRDVDVQAFAHNFLQYSRFIYIALVTQSTVNRRRIFFIVFDFEIIYISSHT
jgi:hypothetical protein